MKIAIDVRALMEDRHSGVQEYTIQIINGLLAVAPQHEYVLFYNSARSVRLPSFSGEVHEVGLSYPNKVFNAFQWALSWPRWDRFLPDVDCVFVPSLRLVPLSFDIPLVTTVHDLSFEMFPEFLDRRRKLWHRLMRPYDLLHRSSGLIAVSEHTASDVEALYDVDPAKISVVYSGVADRWDTSVEAQARVKKTHDLPDRFVLFLGTLEPRKNVSSIVRAFEAIADRVPQDLVIAGGHGWLDQEVVSLVTNSPHASRIHMIGFVDEEDKPALYRLADVFVYPSLYEGFGFPPLEALLSQTPVVASHNSSLPEVVGQWATMINPYDTAEIALVLEELLLDVSNVPDEVPTAIREKFSWRQAALSTVSVLEEAS